MADKKKLIDPDDDLSSDDDDDIKILDTATSPESTEEPSTSHCQPIGETGNSQHKEGVPSLLTMDAELESEAPPTYVSINYCD